MGGRIAQQLMVEHAQRIERVVLLSSAVGGPNAVGPTPRALSGFARNPDRDPAEARRDGILAITGPGFGAREPEALSRLSSIGASKRTPLAVLGKQMQVIATNVCDRLPGVLLPTLVVHGDEDPLVPYGNGQELARLLRSARLVTLHGCGHLAPWEAPTTLLDAILPFLSGDAS
jgi:pimeloyl-ACP methyl ester carboxylesterase